MRKTLTTRTTHLVTISAMASAMFGCGSGIGSYVVDPELLAAAREAVPKAPTFGTLGAIFASDGWSIEPDSPYCDRWCRFSECDSDCDGWLDDDEMEAGSDWCDPESTPPGAPGLTLVCQTITNGLIDSFVNCPPGLSCSTGVILP